MVKHLFLLFSLFEKTQKDWKIFLLLVLYNPNKDLGMKCFKIEIVILSGTRIGLKGLIPYPSFQLPRRYTHSGVV